MREIINRQLVNSAIRHHASLRLTYINNAKVGSGNIKAAMWAQIDRNTGRSTLGKRSPHDRANSPFVPLIFKTEQYDFARFVETPVFTVVRNPFSRILSAYLSKINHGRRNPNGHIVLKNFCIKYGVDAGDTKFGFTDFLKIIASDRVEDLDPHFRPQYINVLYPFSPYAYVGKLERMNEVYDFLKAHDIQPVTFNAYPTDASGQVAAYYNGESEDLIEKIYQDDFDAFGYSLGARNINHIVPVPEREPVANRLAEFIRTKGRGFPTTSSWEIAIKDIRATKIRVR